MQFVKPPRDHRPTTTQNPPRRTAQHDSDQKLEPNTVSSTHTPPSISSALRFSARIIKSAVRHTAKSIAHEAKELFKITEEEFDLDNNPRWQKVRGFIVRLARRIKLPPKLFTLILGLILVIIVATIINQVFFKTQTPTKKSGSTPTSYTSTKLEKGTPKYQTVLPAGKSIESLGGWTRVSPPSASPVYAFVDRIDGVDIIVSQQPLPDAFSQSTAVEEFAKNYSADHKLSVEGTDVFVGTSSKGPQSLIFTKSGLLILIKSSTKLDDSKWADYIGSLQ